MPRSRTVLSAVTLLVCLALTGFPITDAAAAQGTAHASATIYGLHTGTAIGSVDYSQTGAIETVNITVQNLRPNFPYWVANYPNGKCIPATNTPSSGSPSFGIILTDDTGAATFQRTVKTTVDVVENATNSVSIRRGDNSHDLDADGVTGWKDEVGITARRNVGLAGCDTHPVHSIS